MACEHMRHVRLDDVMLAQPRDRGGAQKLVNIAINSFEASGAGDGTRVRDAQRAWRTFLCALGDAPWHVRPSVAGHLGATRVRTFEPTLGLYVV